MQTERARQAWYSSHHIWRRACRLAICTAAVAIATWLSAAPAAAQMLSIQGDRFAVNGQQRFLVFITYFDALDVPDGQLDADLGNLHDAVHIDGIRIFPNWWGQSSRGSSGRFLTGSTVMDGAGNVRFDLWNKLLRILEADHPRRCAN